MFGGSALWILSHLLLTSLSQEYKISGSQEESEVIIESMKTSIDDKLWNLKWKTDKIVKVLEKLMEDEMVHLCPQLLTYNDMYAGISDNFHSLSFNSTCFGKNINQVVQLMNETLFLRNKIDHAVAYGGGNYTDKCDFMVGHYLEKCINDSLKKFIKDYIAFKYQLNEMEIKIMDIIAVV